MVVHSSLVNEFTDPIPPWPEILFIQRKVDDPGFAPDVIQGHGSPKAAIVTVVPVVAHDKQLARGNGNRAEIIPPTAFGAIGRNPMVILVNDVIVFKNGLGRFHQLVIDIQFFIDDLNFIPGNADDPLDKILGWVLGINKHHDITSLWLSEGNQHLIGKRVADAIGKLVYQQVVTDLQGFQHGSGWNGKSLHHKGPDEQSQEQGDDDGFQILPP